ncbi:MAG: hypothetical protein EZS28_002284 [Streblomastix strix]|uniref:Uncharacterized protein n=1 Tax=Streblomastix strix TaxID=222440 RepID=A0A5J4X6Q1_9EUKA|nr:MAG: hypothetical protein EZS28_002284 [Streblomastix strix]
MLIQILRQNEGKIEKLQINYFSRHPLILVDKKAQPSANYSIAKDQSFITQQWKYLPLVSFLSLQPSLKDPFDRLFNSHITYNMTQRLKSGIAKYLSRDQSMISPLLSQTFTSFFFDPELTSGNITKNEYITKDGFERKKIQMQTSRYRSGFNFSLIANSFRAQFIPPSPMVTRFRPSGTQQFTSSEQLDAIDRGFQPKSQVERIADSNEKLNEQGKIALSKYTRNSSPLSSSYVPPIQTYQLVEPTNKDKNQLQINESNINDKRRQGRSQSIGSGQDDSEGAAIRALALFNMQQEKEQKQMKMEDKEEIENDAQQYDDEKAMRIIGEKLKRGKQNMFKDEIAKTLLHQNEISAVLDTDPFINSPLAPPNVNSNFKQINDKNRTYLLPSGQNDFNEKKNIFMNILLGDDEDDHNKDNNTNNPQSFQPQNKQSTIRMNKDSIDEVIQSAILLLGIIGFNLSIKSSQQQNQSKQTQDSFEDLDDEQVFRPPYSTQRIIPLPFTPFYVDMNQQITNEVAFQGSLFSQHVIDTIIYQWIQIEQQKHYKDRFDAPEGIYLPITDRKREFDQLWTVSSIAEEEQTQEENILKEEQQKQNYHRNENYNVIDKQITPKQQQKQQQTEPKDISENSFNIHDLSPHDSLSKRAESVQSSIQSSLNLFHYSKFPLGFFLQGSSVGLRQLYDWGTSFSSPRCFDLALLDQMASVVCSEPHIEFRFTEGNTEELEMEFGDVDKLSAKEAENRIAEIQKQIDLLRIKVKIYKSRKDQRSQQKLDIQIPFSDYDNQNPFSPQTRSPVSEKYGSLMQYNSSNYNRRTMDIPLQYQNQHEQYIEEEEYGLFAEPQDPFSQGDNSASPKPDNILYERQRMASVEVVRSTRTNLNDQQTSGLVREASKKSSMLYNKSFGEAIQEDYLPEDKDEIIKSQLEPIQDLNNEFDPFTSPKLNNQDQNKNSDQKLNQYFFPSYSNDNKQLESDETSRQEQQTPTRIQPQDPDSNTQSPIKISPNKSEQENGFLQSNANIVLQKYDRETLPKFRNIPPLVLNQANTANIHFRNNSYDVRRTIKDLNQLELDKTQPKLDEQKKVQKTPRQHIHHHNKRKSMILPRSSSRDQDNQQGESQYADRYADIDKVIDEYIEMKNTIGEQSNIYVRGAQSSRQRKRRNQGRDDNGMNKRSQQRSHSKSPLQIHSQLHSKQNEDKKKQYKKDSSSEGDELDISEERRLEKRALKISRMMKRLEQKDEDFIGKKK